MDSPVVLHVGVHKTGTTSLQCWMRDHEDLLAEHGYRFPRGWLRLNNHFELPLTLMRLDRASSPRRRGDDWKDPEWREDVLRQITDDLRRHRDVTTILSAENLSLFRYDDEFLALRSIVGDASVVMYCREPSSYLSSLASFFEKNDIVESLDPDAYNYLGADAWHCDYETLISSWRRWFSRVTVIDYDAVTLNDHSVIPSFLRHLHIPVAAAGDPSRYRLNTREGRLKRIDGNRSHGLRFGQSPVPSPPAGHA